MVEAVNHVAEHVLGLEDVLGGALDSAIRRTHDARRFEGVVGRGVQREGGVARAGDVLAAEFGVLAVLGHVGVVGLHRLDEGARRHAHLLGQLLVGSAFSKRPVDSTLLCE